MKRVLMVPALGLALVFTLVELGKAGGQVPAPPAPPPGAPPTPAPSPAPATAPTAAPAALATPYPIVPEAGEWMVCAATYMGPDAPELARQIVLEIRNRHGVAAYVFDRTAEELRRRREEHERIKKLYPPGVRIPFRTVRVQQQCAVLVGGYPDIDAASTALKQVRDWPMPQLKLSGDRLAYDMMNVYSPDAERKQTAVKRVAINPFHNAIVVRNPTVPVETKPEPKFDPLWKELNSGEEYSLLRCGKPWTLVVKEYQGGGYVQPRSASSSFLKMLGLGSQKPGEGLNAAALQAHELARLLRDPRLGFPAYVLHTRRTSIVTVGGFDGPRDPELVRMQQRVEALKFANDKRQDPIGLFAVPAPMEVPRP